MPRYKLTIEYDGTPYAGFQRQENAPSVQQCLEEAIEALCQEKTVVFASGRTDAGVHALGQVVHADMARALEPLQMLRALNFHLQETAVRVIDAALVEDDFHARFSCLGRRYLYRVLNRVASSPLLKNRVWHVPYELDLEAMQRCAKHLIGHHDFSTFRASACQANSPMRTLNVLDIERQKDEIHFSVEAPSFLHHQVRNMVGTLVEVGRGQKTEEDFLKAFGAKQRAAGGVTAPSCGLYFMKAYYDDGSKKSNN